MFARPSTAAAQVVGFHLSQLPHRSGSMTVLPVLPAPTSKKCRPPFPLVAPKMPWPQILGRRWSRLRTRRAAVEATRWDRGVAVSLSPPQGRPSPLLWSPWQPQPLPLLDLSTKVNWWLWMSLGVFFLPWLSCVLCDLGPTADSCVALISMVQLVCDFHNQWPCLEETHREKELMYKHAGRSRLKSRQRTQQLSVSTVIALNLLSGVFVCVSYGSVFVWVWPTCFLSRKSVC